MATVKFSREELELIKEMGIAIDDTMYDNIMMEEEPDEEQQEDNTTCTNPNANKDHLFGISAIRQNLLLREGPNYRENNKDSLDKLIKIKKILLVARDFAETMIKNVMNTELEHYLNVISSQVAEIKQHPNAQEMESAAYLSILSHLSDYFGVQNFITYHRELMKNYFNVHCNIIVAELEGAEYDDILKRNFFEFKGVYHDSIVAFNNAEITHNLMLKTLVADIKKYVIAIQSLYYYFETDDLRTDFDWSIMESYVKMVIHGSFDVIVDYYHNADKLPVTKTKRAASSSADFSKINEPSNMQVFIEYQPGNGLVTTQVRNKRKNKRFKAVAATQNELSKSESSMLDIMLKVLPNNAIVSNVQGNLQVVNNTTEGAVLSKSSNETEGAFYLSDGATSINGNHHYSPLFILAGLNRFVIFENDRTSEYDVEQIDFSDNSKYIAFFKNPCKEKKNVRIRNARNFNTDRDNFVLMVTDRQRGFDPGPDTYQRRLAYERFLAYSKLSIDVRSHWFILFVKHVMLD
jgi:hypothetical protein